MEHRLLKVTHITHQIYFGIIFVNPRWGLFQQISSGSWNILSGFLEPEIYLVNQPTFPTSFEWNHCDQGCVINSRHYTMYNSLDNMTHPGSISGPGKPSIFFINQRRTYGKGGESVLVVHFLVASPTCLFSPVFVFYLGCQSNQWRWNSWQKKKNPLLKTLTLCHVKRPGNLLHDTHPSVPCNMLPEVKTLPKISQVKLRLRPIKAFFD